MELSLKLADIFSLHRWAARRQYVFLSFIRLRHRLLVSFADLLAQLLVQLHFLEPSLVLLSLDDVFLHLDLSSEVNLLDLL